MDPNSLSNLDPKLRETYERVMGTTSQPTVPIGQPADKAPDPASASTPSQSATTPSPTPNASPAVSPMSAPSPIDAAPAVDNISTSATGTDGLSAPVNDQPQNVTINQPLPNPAASVILTKPHGHMGLIKVFYVLGATVFFVIYIFFWMKIFNIQLPF